ncbi:phage BR0599 family protein [Marilutibacter spongiae]|uniref:DUF2163 domain-containing protein n=1 Tax=Marilutibacter spongiae TaxID=2025720 RepID=A0A7W3TP23_9GAMM|nr:phage BR0599 family protein [Lysobacter spongiae]MBB1061878.1 DUF2163 domain-containing protein [Lysobacter spongiae]
MFEDLELSRFFGRKVALYLFKRGAVEHRFTSRDRDLTIGGETYVAARGISHSEIRQTAASPQKNQLTVTVPYRMDPNAADQPVTQVLGDWFNPYPPGERVLVTVMTTHLGDPDEQVNVEWLGRVLGPKFTDTTLELACDPSYRNARTSGRQARIGRNCDVPVYSQGEGMCNLDKAAHEVPATLSAVAGLALTAPAFAAAPRNLGGGFIEWTRLDGLTERRTIWSHAGDTVVVNFGAADLAIGLDLSAYPGCAHNSEACDSYGNGVNYPGYKNLPTSDPLPRSQAWG